MHAIHAAVWSEEWHGSRIFKQKRTGVGRIKPPMVGQKKLVNGTLGVTLRPTFSCTNTRGPHDEAT